MQAVILAAGKGTRMLPLTKEIPKPLLPLANKPILQHHFDTLDVKEIIVVVGANKEKIIEKFGEEYDGKKLVYVEQKEQKGTGHALLQCKKHVKENFVLLMGDDLYSKKMVQKVIENVPSVIAMKHPNASNFGVIESKDGKLVGLQEKPKKPKSDLVNTALYSFTPQIFEELEKTKVSERGEIELTDAMLSLSKKIDFKVIEVNEGWVPIPFPWSLLNGNEKTVNDTKKEILGKVEAGATLKGEVHVGEGTIVKSGVYIEGPVIIGKNCVIGPNSFVRAHSSIGNSCVIGSNVEIKNSIIMNGTRVPRLSCVLDSVVGRNCYLGAGLNIANQRLDGENVRTVVNKKKYDTGKKKFGCVIADSVNVGVNVSVMPGMIIKKDVLPNSIVNKEHVK